MCEVLAATLPAVSSSLPTLPSMLRQAWISATSRPATISAATSPMTSASTQASWSLIGDHRQSPAGRDRRSLSPSLRGWSFAHRHLPEGARGMQDAHAGVVDASDAGEAVGLGAHGLDAADRG